MVLLKRFSAAIHFKNKTGPDTIEMRGIGPDVEEDFAS
ncbi:hypothetical protein AB434_0901 [Heyndrickxia coagulans]|jgi:hypothetical protein|uniref:Uncharacterized protein n=1 Tax=Heyndrickxia coagulans TaxID=1398 RepID=A0AAN0T316_HEYCO|nr:hypothetical protein SB48_HM08orf00396 [Heyndrickxia coagulans]AKN53306.1 hypothetical protein AB434_0901 [Heyndrickxia coagulans]KYC65997.1 hypothetical protein B4100_1626 [Heyndrickxia coagulans]KYC88564.1 hypothetical protein B4096_1569 [Heyndrickxia coagulans]